MKKIKAFIIFMTVLLFASTTWAAGTVTQSIVEISKGVYQVTFICIGDSGNGSIPNTDTADNGSNGNVLNGVIRGTLLYRVEAFPTSGGTAPDVADVMIYDSDGLDLLGSEDGGTTAYAGLSLVHATLKRRTIPNLYLPRAGLHSNDYPLIASVLTLDVDNQGTASADWTIVLTFVRIW